MTELEQRLDADADAKSETHRLFREKHWKHFRSTGTPDAPRISRPDLDRESFRLFQISTAAQKEAADAEHAARRK